MKFLKKRNKKGSIGLVLVFIMLSFFLLFLFAIAIPMLMEVNDSFYSAAGDILSSIDTSQYPAEAQTAIDNAYNSIPQSQQILSFFFQYSWLFIILVLGLVIYLFSRTIIETDTI